MSIERKTHLDMRALTVLLACCVIWGVSQVAVKLTGSVAVRVSSRS